jgi:hypothetical protein
LKFKLEIELGNDGMLTDFDVRNALQNSFLRHHEWYDTALEHGECGGILDQRGNVVGTWIVES